MLPAMANGKLTFLLRPMENDRGRYFMGNGNFPGTIELDEVVFFAYPQEDGSIMVSLEKFEEHKSPKRPKGR